MLLVSKYHNGIILLNFIELFVETCGQFNTTSDSLTCAAYDVSLTTRTGRVVGATLVPLWVKWWNPSLRFLIIILRCSFKTLKSETTRSTTGIIIITIPVTPIAIFGGFLSAFLMPTEAITFSACVFGSSSSGTNMDTSSPVALGK